MLRVFDSGSTTDTGRVTAAAIGSLVGGNKELVKIGNRTLELSGDNSGTFLAGSIVASQGTVRVMHNGSLGSATTAAYFERNATLEIAKSNFVPLGPVLQQPGSIERWNVEDARGLGTYDLPADVNLQLNTNLIAPRTIGLNGGTIEGFLWSDHPAQAVHRTIDPGITINLLANSFVGQNILQGQNYDAGRLPTAAQPFGNTYTGVILCINGTITGAFDLTKTGLDTVIIGGTSNSYNNTIVDMGVLRIGANHALPTGGVLTPRLGGIFDLYGFDQRVSGLGTLTGGPNPGGVSVGSSGHVTNSGVTFNQLQVNHASDYTYNGTIDLNVALTKAGAGTLTIGNGANTYRGATTINEGVLSIDTLADGGLASSIGASSSAAANLVFSGGGALRYTGNSVATDRGFTLNAGGGKIEIPTFATTVLATGTAIGVGSLVKEGDGMLSLGGANTHTGDTRVDGGTLDLAHTNAVQNSTLDTGPAGVQLVTFSVAGTNTYLLGGLKGADDLEISGNTIRVGSNNQTTIFDGALTGVGGSVVKEGAGALTLNGPQSYATLTTTAGRLNLNSTLANAVITDNGGILVINADATNSTVNVNSNPTYFTVSQKLTALSIGPTGRAIVTSTAPAPASDEPAAAFDAASELAAAAAPAAVPEPGTASLLLLGSLALCRSATHRARRRGPRSEHSE
jgi:autotransporter-associated beta strand protein